MPSQSPADQSLETLQDIKRMMERSSRFISLSGLSGVSAGLCALVGSYFAHRLISSYAAEAVTETHPAEAWDVFVWQMMSLGVGVLLAALISSTWFTWRKARKSQLPFWDHASKKLAVNMVIPLATGGFFVVGLLAHNGWNFVAPACLIFYGLALVNASKYTLTDIRYLGLLEIALGCINMYYLHFGLYFWAIGFGALHIIYGLIMWWKYERGAER